MEKRHTVFGYHVARPFDYAAVVESPLDAVRLFQIGVPAVSLLGAWVSQEQVSLLARNFSAVYMALDNDKAGHEGTEILQAGLRKHGCAAVPWDYTGLVDDSGEPCKDVGDVPHDDMLLSAWDRTRRMGL
jgi:DNA primase